MRPKGDRAMRNCIVNEPFTSQTREKENKGLASSAFHPAIRVPGTRAGTAGVGHDSADKFPMPMRIAIIIGMGLASWAPILLLVT